jgi:YidC/Oxa1 family membrane protein insertase
MEEENRNFLLFFVVMAIIMFGYPFFLANRGSVSRQIPPNAAAVNQTQALPGSAANGEVVPAVRRAKIEQISVESANLVGTISSCGARICDISLKKYQQGADNGGGTSKNTAVSGANPRGGRLVPVFGDEKSKYYADTGWSCDDKSVLLPDENTCWQVDGKKLSENSPITLTWDNNDGLLFERKISIDKNYVLTIMDSVKNYGKQQPIALKSITRVYREFKKKDSAFSCYEGPLGYVDGKLQEVSYEDILKEGEIKHSSVGGWFGITDKYWLVAFIPDQKQELAVSYNHVSYADRDAYRVESCEECVLGPSETISKTHHLFAGAKEIKTLDMYEKKLNVQHLDLAIDFGWLYLLTKPLLYSLAFLKDIVGNMGIGIILLTLLIKLLLLPLANKSYRSMNRLKEIDPKIQALRRKYANDKMQLGQEISALYKKEGISPIGGCLPTLLQSPVLFALYKVLYISIEMRQAPFVGWIHDLSLPDPMWLLNLFGLIHIDLPGFLQIGVWPILMGLSMFWQQKITPSTADNEQAKIMLVVMPTMFTIMFAQMPSGLVVYWTFSNVLAILQQYVITKKK